MTGNYSITLCLIAISTYFLSSTIARETIVGGRQVLSARQFKYQVSLQDYRHNHVCGGAIISEKSIITVAECVIARDGEPLHRQLYALLDSVNVRTRGIPALRLAVWKIKVSAEYDPRSDSYVHFNGIAILQLRDAYLGYPVAWLQFPELPHQYYAGQNATIASFGWNRVRSSGGGDRVTGSTDGRLRYARATVLTDHACEQAFPHGTINTDRHFCAKILRRRPGHAIGVCYGDIGSVLVHEHHYQDDNATFIGVLIKNSPTCDERQHPGIYASVSHYREFIENATTEYSSDAIRTYYL